MQDIDPEELKMGNDHVHGAVGKMAGSLSEIVEAVMASGKSYEKILDFLQEQ